LEEGWDGDVRRWGWRVAEGEGGREWLVVDPGVTEIVWGVDGREMTMLYMDG
jgi:hypothetical protein